MRKEGQKRVNDYKREKKRAIALWNSFQLAKPSGKIKKKKKRDGIEGGESPSGEGGVERERKKGRSNISSIRAQGVTDAAGTVG